MQVGEETAEGQDWEDMFEAGKTVLEIHLGIQNRFRSYLDDRMLLGTHNLYGQSYKIMINS